MYDALCLTFANSQLTSLFIFLISWNLKWFCYCSSVWILFHLLNLQKKLMTEYRITVLGCFWDFTYCLNFLSCHIHFRKRSFNLFNISRKTPTVVRIKLKATGWRTCWVKSIIEGNKGKEESWKRGELRQAESWERWGEEEMWGRCVEEVKRYQGDAD